MACTSSNPSPASKNNVCRYDVFLSFQGKTRYNFTDQLYKALQDAGLIPFRDNDDIERGEDLKPEIQRGIRESRASIIVLSKHYATSRWCLEELCLILEQATKRRHFVLPIFYHVDPAHVRNQEESFEINVIPDDTKWTEDNVERWKAALTKVGNMAGEVPSGSETKFLEKVVSIIEKKLDLKKVYLKANLVGMDTWRKEVDYWFERSGAQILAVWGMGGIGKTTLARHIVYSNWENFGSISILEDIGSRSTEQLLELQKKLLVDIFHGKKKKIPSVCQGTCKIENALQTEKALIVLDNIVEPSHLFELLGTGIETQCKIIITTKQSNPHEWFDQSTSWRCQELEMKSLDKNDSLELLSYHAFGSKVPTEGYNNLVEKALRYCEGNSLALEVLGSSLSRKSKQYWESKLKLFENELHDGIHSVLISSYESLPHENCKRLFLHIACFFVGKNRDFVVKILDPDFSAFSEIETLSKSCLLSISPNNELMMHRMLQEMARTIVYKESPLNPVKRSRVWRDAESYDILKNGKGSKNIEGLALDINLVNEGKVHHENKSSSDLTTKSFKKMKQLKLLQLNGVGLSGPYENFSQHLRWLCWIGFGLRAIPSDLCMKNLVALDMSYSWLEEFEPPADLLSVKILNLRSSKKLREIRNIHRLRYLEILILWDCSSLTRVTLGGLTCLVILNITGCKKLCTREEISQKGLFQKIKRKLSQKGSSLHSIKSTRQASFLLPQSLERLFSSSCNLNDTDYFPLTFKDQPLLKYLNLVNGLFEFLPSYNHLKHLRVLDVSGCNDLKELLHLPSTLAELYIYYCNSLNIVTFESHRFALQEFGYEGCVNLCEVEGLFKLILVTKLEESDLKHMTWLREYQDLNVCLVGDAELTKGRSSCVQMLYEFNVMSTSLPNIKNSNMMTDTDYMYTSQSTLLSFKVPACPENRRLEGLIITFQYTAHGEDWVWFAKISTPSGLNLMYNPRVFGKPDEVGMWSSYWPIGKALQIEETVTVSIVVIKGLLDIHWCGASLVYTDEAANEHLQENKECVAILGEDFSEFQLNTGDYYLCRRDFFELMESGKLTPDWFSILVDDKINYTEVGGWRMTGKPEHPYQSYTEVKTIRCIMYGPEMEEIYKISELSKSSLVEKTMESTSDISPAIPMAGGSAGITAVAYPKRPGEPPCQYYLRTGICKFGASCKFHHPRHAGGSSSDALLNTYGYPLRSDMVINEILASTSSSLFEKIESSEPDMSRMFLQEKEVYQHEIEQARPVDVETVLEKDSYEVVANQRTTEINPKDKSKISALVGVNKEALKDRGSTHFAALSFTFRELAAAAKNFRDDCLLGEGGFGRVYKGRLESTNQVVAIKQLDRNGLQGNREFLAEVLMLSLLHHPNLVNLIGYCADGDQRLLVYEYMPLGSLEDHLHDLPPDKQQLDWNTRMKIAAGAAKGLEYLHDKASPPVIYRDLKCSNILLDEEYNPKLSDFGLAKLGPVGDKTHMSTRVTGTYGYCAPEYAMTSQLTLKSDIYSFGVVFLEIITGRKAIDHAKTGCEHNLVAWARPLFKDRRKFGQLADPMLQGQYPARGLYQALAVAAICLQEQPNERPVIADVVIALTYLASQKYDPQASNHSSTPRIQRNK